MTGLLERRECLRLLAVYAEMVQGEGFPQMVEECVDKYVFMSELKAGVWCPLNPGAGRTPRVEHNV